MGGRGDRGRPGGASVTLDGLAASLAAFLEMGGHGFYVWLSYGAGLIIVLYNVLSVRIATHRFFRDARDRQRRSPEMRLRTVSGDALAGDPAAGDEEL